MKMQCKEFKHNIEIIYVINLFSLCLLKSFANEDTTVIKLKHFRISKKISYSSCQDFFLLQCFVQGKIAWNEKVRLGPSLDYS